MAFSGRRCCISNLLQPFKMGGRLKIPKTHISIQKACEELKVTEDQFKKLIIHLNIRAENVRSIYKLSCSDANTYSLKDVNRIYNSRLYATMQKNNQREMEKKLWQGRNRDDIADRMHDLDYDYVNVISNKYASFSDAVGDLGETLTFLYIYQFFNKQMNDDEGLFGTVNAELAKFERFITENMLIKSVYPTKKGLHLLLRIGVIEILFFVPLSSNFTDLRRKDLLPYIKLYMYHLMMVNCKIRNVNIDVLTNTSSKDIIGKEGNADKTVNKDRMGEDVKRCTKANKIFQNLKICIGGMVLAHWLKMLCLSAGGEITDECDYFVTEGKIDQLNGAVSYVHPSFIVNSYNQGSLVDKEEYLIGKGSVEYLYPFESHNKKYDKDFIDTLSKTKRKNVSEYLENIRKSTYFS